MDQISLSEGCRKIVDSGELRRVIEAIVNQELADLAPQMHGHVLAGRLHEAAVVAGRIEAFEAIPALIEREAVKP